MTLTPVHEHRLANGLTLLTCEVRRAPIVSFYVWYRVGGRNERPGITGVSHWAEHMVFKGTKRFPKGQADKLVAMHGGVRNGFTWIDYTAYYETLPSEHARLALEIEADRMANSIFDPDEVAGERGVIISEREGNENHPGFYLGEELTAAAFKLHPYGQPVVGYKSDLHTITREDLWQHYRQYYAPNNAVAVAVGDFDTAEFVKAVESEFGGIPRRDPPPEVRLVEPPQEGKQAGHGAPPGPVSQMSIAYHVPAGAHPDTLPLWLLSSVLSTGRSSRLYKALVMSGLASGAGAGSALTRDPYLFRISATARPDVDPQRLEAAALAEVDRLIQDGVSDSQLAKVRRQMRAGHLVQHRGCDQPGEYLGQYEVAHTWRAFETYVDDLVAVRPEDVVRVAATYLTPDNRTVGWFLPSQPSRRATPGGPRGGGARPAAMAAGRAPTPAAGGPR